MMQHYERKESPRPPRKNKYDERNYYNDDYPTDDYPNMNSGFRN